MTISTSRASNVVDRITPLLRRDFLSVRINTTLKPFFFLYTHLEKKTLPYELALHVLSFVDFPALVQICQVSRRWQELGQDQTLWRQLFIDRGWGYDQDMMQRYVSEEPSASLRDDYPSLLAPVPLARTTASIYDPAALPTMPGAPPSSTSGRLRPFKRPGDLFLRLRQRRIMHAAQTDTASDDGTASSAPHDENEHTDEEPFHDTVTDTTPSSSSSSSLRLTTTALPPLRLPLPSPTSYSRSQPLLSSRPQSTSSTSSLRRGLPAPSHSTAAFPTSPKEYASARGSAVASVIERPFRNRPPPRRHIKNDETAVYHYNEASDTRYINWRRLYRNRSLIEKRWREGKCKMRVFPPTSALPGDMHLEGIYCLQFDEDKIISGSRDRSIKIWDMRTGECRRSLVGHSASVLCLQYDDRYIISGSSDTTIVQWDIERGTKVRTLFGHMESVLNLRFSSDRIVSCSKDRTVRIWDLDGNPLKVLRGHRAAVNAVQFQGRQVVSASGDRTIKLWDMDTGACLRTFDSHSRGIACVEFDGVRIVSGSSDQTIKIWDAATGECIHTLAGHTDLVRTLQLDTKADRIISGSYDGSLRIWSLSQGCLLRSLSQAIEGRYVAFFLSC